jgi:hypothetical protein
MDTRAEILVALILSLEQFDRQLGGITADNRRQLAKAREHIDDSERQMTPETRRPVRKNRSFIP